MPAVVRAAVVSSPRGRHAPSEQEACAPAASVLAAALESAAEVLESPADVLEGTGEAPGADESLEAPAPQPRRRPGWLRDVSGIALVGFLFYTLSFHVSVVRGSSMSPGIHDGDRILVEPWSYVLGGVSRGDVVVMRSPLDPAIDYIKRVIGLPGDEILIAAGAVWVNGELLEEPYAVPGDASLYQWTRVLDDHYFVLGDNRPHSSDSREFGQVPARFLRGRVDLCVWPLPRAGLVD